jgi:hypothetical protein
MSYIQVLNPSVKMSWIKNHWDLEWIASSEQIIKDEVCDF